MQKFAHQVHVELWPAVYKLYFVFDDPDKERIQLTEDTFQEIFQFIVHESSGNALYSHGIIYSFDCSASKEKSPPMKLTAQNLRLHCTQITEEKYSAEGENEDTMDNDTESVQTRDSNLQREMNTVICRRSAGDVDLQAAHIFEMRERKQMTISTWLSTKSELKIDSLYGPKNGFSQCTLCHKMYDRKLLSIECVPGSSGAEYRIRCEPGTLTDPLFAYQQHANQINGKLVLTPTDTILKLHWPEPELVMRRVQNHVRYTSEKAADEALYSLECPNCGKLYKKLSALDTLVMPTVHLVSAEGLVVLQGFASRTRNENVCRKKQFCPRCKICRCEVAD